MFITLTINTNIKKKPLFNIRKRKINTAKGWRMAVFTKKRTLWQRIKSWRKSLRPGHYELGEQAVMF